MQGPSRSPQGSQDRDDREPKVGAVFAAGLVHAFTASGILCALAATLAVAEGRYAATFGWLALAFLIDGIDGTFARAVQVKKVLPRFSGEQLDLVVDYVTYVFVPVLALLHARYLEGAVGLALAGFILMSSLFHFSDLCSKAPDNCFVGFPAIWNIVAFYVFAFDFSPEVTAVLILGLGLLTFVPMRWVHPMRLVRLRGVTLALTVLWLGVAVAVVWHGFPAALWAKVVLGAIAVYGVGLTLSMPWAVPRRGEDT